MNKLEYMARAIGYRSLPRFQARANFVFRGLTLTGKSLLDVGCGRGDFALWAALHGASYALGIEPESHGSTHGTFEIFRRLIIEMGLQDFVEAKDIALEQVCIDKPFDIVILYNVINHLDEVSVRNMHQDLMAFEVYRKIVYKIRLLMKSGGVVILGDCARSNFWPRLGMPSPLARNIEWDKHQDPHIWIKLFTGAGFQFLDLRWSPLYPFGRLTGNFLVQYFTTSHFVLRFIAI